MLHVGIGNQLDSLTYVLGEFSSVSATATIAYPTVTVIDGSGKPTGDIVSPTAADHVAFTGKLKSGAIASVTWRSGYSSTKGREQFVWIIDGDDGSISLENDAGTSERF
jgi:predicted dehydrogenase